MEATDQILLARIADGDRVAFGTFYDRHAGRIHSLVLRICRNPREAEDVLQETFWAVWGKAHQFDARRGTPLAWLILLARSRCLDALRRTRRRPSTSNPTELGDAPAPDDPVEQTHRGDEAIRARRALASLPCDQRQAIELAFFDGLSHQQIAERLNTALGTVKTRIRLGMSKLRDLLGEPTNAAMAI